MSWRQLALEAPDLAAFPGNPVTPVPTVAAMLGIDNIEARDSVPTPATAALFAIGVVVARLRRRRS